MSVGDTGGTMGHRPEGWCKFKWYPAPVKKLRESVGHFSAHTISIVLKAMVLPLCMVELYPTAA